MLTAITVAACSIVTEFAASNPQHICTIKSTTQFAPSNPQHILYHQVHNTFCTIKSTTQFAPSSPQHILHHQIHNTFLHKSEILFVFK